ncbi:HNH endonuclease [Cumulibacter soli]|uniref:HNH endonuclease n=1 Tax=Cumulibacter soli TaxID=2546344 RepID=UPI001FB92F23|nr:HNH endonuclease [Cumulibacter soli]
MTTMPIRSQHEPIVLLNASYEPLSMNVTLKRAARLLAKGKAIVLEAAKGRFLRDWPWPRVLILVKYVRIAHEVLYRRPTVSRKGVLKRDSYRCAYCADRANTIDHVLPKSRGGGMTWTNLVAACLRCNSRKRNRTPEEAGMPLRLTPFVPTRLALGDSGATVAIPA